MDWVGIGIIVVVGIAVVAYGWLSDRTANRRRAEALNAPPDRPIPGLKPSADAPQYFLPDDLDAKPSLPAAELTALRDRLSGATSLPHGHGKGAFASDHASGLAVLADPLILIVDGDLSSTRELLPVIAKATAASRPLVVVAERIAADVYHTLEVNTLAGKLASDAVPITDSARRAHLAELVDATAISPANLKSGWVPDASLGTCATWVSSPTQLWLLDAS
jgi:hypothetical protein